MHMNPSQLVAYRGLLDHALIHRTDTARAAGAILLNSYNDRLPHTGFNVGELRHFDSKNRANVLIYLEWLSSAPGLYPPSSDVDELKRAWEERGWLRRQVR